MRDASAAGEGGVAAPRPDGAGKVVAVFGPTGTAGAGVVEACLAHPGVSQVRAVTRRPLGRSDAKLREIGCADFADPGGLAPALEGVDCCLFCLGTSVRNVSGEDEYRRIHVTYALAAAQALLADSPDATFVYLSGGGADRRSRMMWARVKAQAEDALSALPLARLANVRPGGILPMRPTGVNRWIVAPILKLVPGLGIGSAELGGAMLHLGLDEGWNGRRTLGNRQIRELLPALAGDVAG